MLFFFFKEYTFPFKDVRVQPQDEFDYDLFDFDLSFLFMKFSIENILKVILAILHESQILFISKNTGILNPIIQVRFEPADLSASPTSTFNFKVLHEIDSTIQMASSVCSSLASHANRIHRSTEPVHHGLHNPFGNEPVWSSEEDLQKKFYRFRRFQICLKNRVMVWSLWKLTKAKWIFPLVWTWLNSLFRVCNL